MQWRIAEGRRQHRTSATHVASEVQAAWQTAIDNLRRHHPGAGVESLRSRRVIARVRMIDNSGRFSRWSAPIEFTVGAEYAPARSPAARITEVHYHPRSDRHEEFIEIGQPQR